MAKPSLGLWYLLAAINAIKREAKRVWLLLLSGDAANAAGGIASSPRSMEWAVFAKRRKQLQLLLLMMLRDIRSPRTAAVCIIPLMLPPTCSFFPLAFNE